MGIEPGLPLMATEGVHCALYQVHGAAACFYTAGGIVLAAAATAGARRLLVIRSAELA